MLYISFSSADQPSPALSAAHPCRPSMSGERAGDRTNCGCSMNAFYSRAGSEQYAICMAATRCLDCSAAYRQRSTPGHAGGCHCNGGMQSRQPALHPHADSSLGHLSSSASTMAASKAPPCLEGARPLLVRALLRQANPRPPGWRSSQTQPAWQEAGHQSSLGASAWRSSAESGRTGWQTVCQ